MRLHDVLDEVARVEAPPSRVEAAATVRIGRRRLWRRRLVAVAAAITALALVGVLVTALRPGPDRTEFATPGPGVVGLYGVDLAHLYAVRRTCAECRADLLGSADGGRTWRVLTTFDGKSEPVVYGPEEVFVADGDHGQSTVDGGRTWQRLRRAETETESGTFLHCAPLPAGAFRGLHEVPEVEPPHYCALDAVNQPSGLWQRLRTQPLEYMRMSRRPDGTTWVAGIDPRNRRLAVARTTDGGRGWSQTLFMDGPPAEVASGLVAVGSGGVVYALFDTDTGRRAFRQTDGVWESVAAPTGKIASLYVLPDGGLGASPYPVATVRGGYVTTDGTHLLTSTDGATWRVAH
jgi:hypothetical protein